MPIAATEKSKGPSKGRKVLAFLAVLILIFLAVAVLPRHRTQESESWKESGLASFYSVRSNGGTVTASGEDLNDNALTAAHPTLPFNSVVKVTHPPSKRSVTVRIIDRGPYSRGRVIDLSVAAAKELGMTEAGVVPVDIVLLRQNP